MKFSRAVSVSLCALMCAGAAMAQTAGGKPAAAPAPQAAEQPVQKSEPAPPKKQTAGLEPMCLAIEPAALRTALARTLPGSHLTVMAPAKEHDLGLKLLTPEEFKALGLTWQEFEAKAAAAANRHLKTLKPEMKKSADGKSSYAVIKSDRHLTASVLFAPSLPDLFRDTFGDRLVVLMPDRFTLYIFPRGFPDFQKLGKQVVTEFNDAVWPCSLEAFEVSTDGVRCIGSFSDGDAPAAASEKP